MERLRRACIKIVDREGEDKSRASISLLMSICGVLEGVFKQVGFKLMYVPMNL